MAATNNTTKPAFRPIAARACADAILNACDPNDPSKGVREVGGNNRGPAVEKYLKMAGAKKGDPWCAAFAYSRYVLACERINEAGGSVKIPSWFPRSAACASFKSAAKKQGLWRSAATVRAGKYTPKAGDMVIFDWDDEPGNDHCGIVRGYDADSETVFTVEGNTTGVAGVSRESNLGDGVWKKARSLASLGKGGGVIQIDF